MAEARDFTKALEQADEALARAAEDEVARRRVWARLERQRQPSKAPSLILAFAAGVAALSGALWFTTRERGGAPDIVPLPPVAPTLEHAKPAMPRASVAAEPMPEPLASVSPAPSASAPGGEGTLLAIAVKGQCTFLVDGADHGRQASLRLRVAPGKHTVTCLCRSGARQSRTVTVARDKPGVASFKADGC
jgi:hypothetical protein